MARWMGYQDPRATAAKGWELVGSSHAEWAAGLRGKPWDWVGLTAGRDVSFLLHEKAGGDATTQGGTQTQNLALGSVAQGGQGSVPLQGTPSCTYRSGGAWPLRPACPA